MNQQNVSHTNPAISCVLIYTDGASRGNPGPSASAYVITDQNGTVLDKGAQYLGVRTNNSAEYSAVEMGLARATAHCTHKAIVRSDSQLVVSQLNHRYRIKNDSMREHVIRVRQAESLFRDGVEFEHVPRTHPRIVGADTLAAACLDRLK